MQPLLIFIVTIVQWLADLLRSYGLAIIVFSVTLKMVLLPLTFYGMRWQDRFKIYFKKAKHEIAALDTKNKARRDDQILDIYQKNGINFSNQCKALLPLLIQLPLLIAFYRAATSWEALDGETFLWIRDLSVVDNLFPLGVTLPWMGSSFNLLPFMLFTVNAAEVVLFREEPLRPKSFSLPIIFFFLFYPFPAACMIFWVTLNVVHVFERWYFVAVIQKREKAINAVEA